MSELYKIAKKILQNGKGILAADESTGTMQKRLESVNIVSNDFASGSVNHSTWKCRNKRSDMLFLAPPGGAHVPKNDVFATALKNNFFLS